MSETNVIEGKPRFAKLNVGQMTLQETAANVWLARPEAGVTKDDMLRPVYWAHVAKKLRTADTIKVLAADATWYAEFVVRAAGPLEAVVGEIKFAEFKAIESAAPEEYDIAWAGPSAKFRVTRRSDKATMKDGFASKEAAAAWLAMPLEDRIAA